MTKRLTIALVALIALVLVAVLPASATYYAVNNTINTGATVYIGEQQLDLTPLYDATLLANPTWTGTIGHWSSGYDPYSTAPATTTSIATGYTSYSIDQATFYGTSGAYLGLWYPVDPSTGWAIGSAVLNVKDPSLSIDAWDYNTSQIVTGQTVIQGDVLTFRVTNNLNNVYDYPTRTYMVSGVETAQPANMDIRLKSDTGNTYNAVYGHTGTVQLTQVHVNLSSWFLGTSGNTAPTTSNIVAGWWTGATDSNGQLAYPAGVYSVYVESRVNGMKDNYQNNGAAYTGKTVSATGTVTIASNTVKIEANKDSVVRSKPFSVTVTGKPNTYYYLWVKGTSSMDNTYDNQPPSITANQVGVYNDAQDSLTLDYLYNHYADYQDPTTLPAYIGIYQYQNAGSSYNLYRYVGGNNSASYPDYWRESLYGIVQLNDAGTRTIQFTTTNFTKAQKYTIRVEQNFGGSVGYKSDEVDVKVEKGAVTIVAAGDQTYYIGEEVKFSGTNTESTTTYLFISGPNLKDAGSQIQDPDPRNHAVVNGEADTFQTADVLGDNTWSWKWGTSSYALDAGTYTVYAVSIPADANNLNNAAYGTVSIIIKNPFISATASQSTVAQGDPVYITGTAQGQPSQGVRIWILGKNFAGVATESVNSDNSFSYELKREATENMYAGQYFIVAQHPMQNDQFDVYPAEYAGSSASGMPIDSSDVQVYTVDQDIGAPSGTDTADFKLTGSGSLQGSNAAEALIEAINDANVDDTYTKLQILVENPVITIDTVGDRHVGDKFTITATTNLAVDDEVLFEVYSSSFQPTTKSQSGEFSGVSQTVKVTQGDSGLNKLSLDVDASTFKPDEYLVKATEVLSPQATGTALFNVLEAQPTTVATTAVATTAAPTTVATTVAPTTVPTTAPTTTPGFGALIALIGLGAIAFVIVRRH